MDYLGVVGREACRLGSGELSPGIRVDDPCRCRVGQFVCRGMTCSGELKAFLVQELTGISHLCQE